MTTQNNNPARPSDLVELARITCEANRFLFIEGSGGAGKTSIVKEVIAPALGRRVFDVNLNGQGPQEAIGYGRPMPNGDLAFYAPEFWPTLERVGNEPVLLFLDELNDYDPAVRALLRGLFPAGGARKVGPHTLGTDVFVVCAANRRMDGTRAAVEEAPFTERCVKVTLMPNLDDWLDWYDSHEVLAATESHVPAFLRFGVATNESGEADLFAPPVDLPYTGTPHPCPRTWEAVALAEKHREANPRIFDLLVRGSVGPRAAQAYAAFLSHVDSLPDIAAIKADPYGFPLSHDPAQQFALVSACLAVSLRGLDDPAMAVHSGDLDWFTTTLLRCRGDIRSFGARSAVRRGIPLDEHPKSHDLLV